MKKISMIFLCVLLVMLTVGCKQAEDKEQKLICTTTQSEEGLDIEQVISMTYKNDKLKYMQLEVNTKVTDTTLQKEWEMFKETMDKQNQEFNKDGVSLTIEKDDKNFAYNVILNIDVDNATEEALAEQGFSDLKDDDSTLESSKAEAEKDGAVCVIK